MVVALGPVRFYGNSLPRPRFYTDVKLNSERVDPPRPVMEPLLWWAADAHWSMGGQSFERLRLQGRIEGSIEKLRLQLEYQADKRRVILSLPAKPVKKSSSDKKIPTSPDLIDSDSSEEEGGLTLAEMVRRRKRMTRGKRARKLVDVFDGIAAEEEEEEVSVIASRTRSRMGAVEETVVTAQSPEKGLKRKQVVARRTSPRKKTVV